MLIFNYTDVFYNDTQSCFLFYLFISFQGITRCRSNLMTNISRTALSSFPLHHCQMTPAYLPSPACRWVIPDQTLSRTELCGEGSLFYVAAGRVRFRDSWERMAAPLSAHSLRDCESTWWRAQNSLSWDETSVLAVPFTKSEGVCQERQMSMAK